jgi:hypothetical protein
MAALSKLPGIPVGKVSGLQDGSIPRGPLNSHPALGWTVCDERGGMNYKPRPTFSVPPPIRTRIRQ